MINKDYIMRMIEQLSIVLSNVLLKREQNNLNEANILLDSACKDLIGLEYFIIRSLSAEKLFEIINLNRGDFISAGKLIIAAKLLFEKARIEEDGNADGGDCLSVYKKSLYLYLKGFGLAGEYNGCKDYLEDIDTILKKNPCEELKCELIYNLFHFFRKCGKYNEAENILFCLKDTNFPGICEEGKQFYKDLENLCDGELAKANFTRDEIKSGLEDLLNSPA